MIRNRALALGMVVSASAFGASCGGKNLAEPELIPGGGVGSGEIDGRLNVFVVDAEDDSPIAGATVRVGEPSDAAPLTGTTDSMGLVVFESDALEGPQTITVSASGYPATTLFGVNGANVTATLEQGTPATVATATVSGSIQGLPTAANGHVIGAAVFYSLTDDLGAPENSIPQGGGPGLPPNVCLLIGTTECNFTIKTRTGKQILYAVVFDRDTKGTPANPNDDTQTVIGFAAKGGYDLAAGSTLSGEVLPVVSANDVKNATVSFGSVPAGLPEVVAAPFIDAGDEGLVHFFAAPVTPDMPTTKVPALTGAFANGSYLLVARATTTLQDEVPASWSLLHHVNFDTEVALPTWLATPSTLSASGGTYSFTPAPGADLQTVDFRNEAGETRWTVAIFDGRTSFTLPMVSPDPLPTGETLTMRVSSFQVDGFDPSSFRVNELFDRLKAFSAEETTFTR